MTPDELKAKYRALFLSDMGQDVLADILVEFCHFGVFHVGGNAEQDGAYNVGISIMSRMGILEPGMDKDLVRAMCATAPGARLVVVQDREE